MRIGLLHDSILPPKNYGGIERIVVSLAAEYQRSGHKVTVLCRKGSKFNNLDTFELPINFQTKHPSSWLPKNLDFLHSHQPISFKPEIPFLVTSHGNGHPNELYWKNTNFLSQSHARNHNGKYFIYNGLDPKNFPFVEKKEDYVVFLARATWRIKNLKTCIDFARDLGIRLEVIGGRGIDTKYVKYHGMLGENQGKLNILSKARALIYPTNWDEPCAVAPLEALACGTPVIASSNGCMPELVREGTGFICRDYKDLLRSLSKLDSVKPENCRKSIEDFFNLERMAQNYLSLMDEIIKKGELNHEPKYNFNPKSVEFIFKPSLINKLRFSITGKI
jgi:glycosyltransferase involved in cell wall biosynthesis